MVSLNSSVTNALYQADLHLADLLNLFKKEILLDFNCIHVGTIQSFNSITQTVQVTINYTKTYFQINSIGLYEQYQVNYPPLENIPIVLIGGGDCVLTMPINVGDECLVLFNDRDIDNWYTTGSTGAPVSTGRLHSYADAIALVGVNSVPNVVPAYESDLASLRTKDGTAKMSVSSSKVSLTFGVNTLTLDSEALKITLGTSGTSFEINTSGKLKVDNLSGEFVAALVQLFQDIASGTVTTMLGPQPLVMPTFTTDLAVLQSFKE